MWFFDLSEHEAVIAFRLLMLLEFLRKLFKLQAFLFKEKWSTSTQKSNQKVSANKSKNHTLAFATANALGSICIVFWGASHLRNNWTLICAYWTLPRTPKNQTVQQEFQISVLDKKHFNRFWFFHPAPKFETLARRPRLRNKKIRLPKENPAPKAKK